MFRCRLLTASIVTDTTDTCPWAVVIHNNEFVAAVPEPASLMLISLGGLALLRRRR